VFVSVSVFVFVAGWRAACTVPAALAHLALAFSRDGDGTPLEQPPPMVATALVTSEQPEKKVYVQQRILEHGPELAALLLAEASVARLYICGDGECVQITLVISAGKPVCLCM
jgi:sulfite reductase alpha subunit-like flavoprotein